MENQGFDLHSFLSRWLPLFGYLSLLATIVTLVVTKLLNLNVEKRDLKKKEQDTELSRAQTVKTESEATQIVTEQLLKATTELQKTREAMNTLYDQLRTQDSEHAGETSKLKDEVETIGEQLSKAEFMCHRTVLSMRRLMEKLDTPFWEVDGAGQIKYINDSWLAMFKVTTDTVNHWIDAVIKEDRLRIVQEWKDRLLNQDAESALFFSITNTDGKIIKVKSTYCIIRGRSGDVETIIGTTTEIKDG